MKYQALRKKYNGYASWGIWDPNDINITPSDDVNGKNPKYVFVGLNASKAKDGRIWGNFHFRHRGGHDGNLRSAIMGTKFEGAYLTDILKYPDEPIGAKVDAYFKEHPGELKKHFDMFSDELDLLGDVETIFVFGKIAQKYVDRFMKENPKYSEIRVVKLTHYSASSMYAKGAYRNYLKDVAKREGLI